MTAAEVATWRQIGAIAIVTLDNPPVNVLSRAVRAAIVEAVRRANDDADVAALVVACAGRTLFASADLREFGKPSLAPFLTEVVDSVEASAKPVVAAIHGTALGGGLEIAMACHYRVAQEDARLGLPEVKLGLMPGARGTQHLPRLVGVEWALDIIALGDPVSGKQAHADGLIDALAGDDVVGDAVAFAQRVSDRPFVPTRDRRAASADEGVYLRFAERHAPAFRGLDAPPAIMRSVRAAIELPFAEGAQRERDIFLKLCAGPQNEALRYLFFAERDAAKAPAVAGVSARPIAAAGVIGGGSAGVALVTALLRAGLPVILHESNGDLPIHGDRPIRDALARETNAGRLSADAAANVMSALTIAADPGFLAKADILVDASSATTDEGCAVLARLGGIAKPGALLACGGVRIDIGRAAAASGRPGDVVGTHVCAPDGIARLLEIVGVGATDPDALATAFGLARRLGIVTVGGGDGPRRIAGRMLAACRREADAMIADGVPARRIDDVAEPLGLSIGAGQAGKGRAPGRSGAPIVAQGGRRLPSDDPAILDQLLYAMADEGARILNKGVATRESDIDVACVHGFGWPAWTGGPMFHARLTRHAEVARLLQSLGRDPSAALVRLAAEVGGRA